MGIPETNDGIGLRNGFVSRSPTLAKIRERSMTRGFAIAMAGLVLFGMIAVTETLLHFQTHNEVSERTAASLAFASELRAIVDRELNSILYLSSGIVGYLVVRHDNLDPRETTDILKAVYIRSRSIRNFTIAIGSQVAYVYPEEGNKEILGMDYRNLPAQWPAIKAAIDLRTSTLTGPVNLVQGGRALIYRIPIFIDNTYWGLLSTVIDMSSFEKAAFKTLDEKPFEFAIRGVEPVGSGGGLMWGRPELFSDPSAVQLETEVPNGKWIYAFRMNRQLGGTLRWVNRGMGWFLAILAGLAVFGLLRQRSRLSRIAGFDHLTNLPNRRLFDDRLEQNIYRLSRNDGQQIAVIFIDLNDFKPINDRHGHRSGDQVLQVIARRLREEVRLSDTVSRWAGDEFAIIIEDATSDLVSNLIDRLHKRIEEPVEIGGAVLRIGASIGAALYPREAATAGELLELADRRMYRNKEEGSCHS